jgi:hypothetical protein
MHLIDHFLLSYSPISGMVIIGLLSAVVALPSAWIKWKSLRWGFLYAFPIVMAYKLYWYSVKLEEHPSDEFAAWQFVFIILWGGVGIMASTIVADATRRLRNAKSRSSA